MLLTINTAFMDANIGLVLDSGKILSRTIDAKSKHSENVLKTIDEMCEEGNVRFRDIDKVAVVIGPGSFTGIRIGVAIVKALGCVNLSLKVYPITSLELMAYIYLQNHKEKITCVLNALSNLYFTAKFDGDGKKLEKEKMVDKLNDDEKIIVLKGDLNLPNSVSVELNTVSLVDFALKKIEKDMPISAENLEPLYLRPSQAEANLKSNKKND